MNQKLKTILAILAAAAVLALAFWLAFGGDVSAEAPQSPEEPTVQTPQQSEPQPIEEPAEPPAQGQETDEAPSAPAAGEEQTRPATEPDAPEESAEPVEPENEPEPDAAEQEQPVSAGAQAPQQPTEPEKTVCTISISCATVLDKLDSLSESVAQIVPADGWILAPVQEEFEDGESVLDILLRVTQRERIHMEYAGTATGNSAYLEGIGNLYEFDAGELSGWMYCVNGVFPNYGCGQYFPQPGDEIRLVYTCDLGADVGDSYQP